MKDYRHIKQFADDNNNIESYKNLIRNGMIKVVNGELCLDFRPAKVGNNTYGQVYEFDAKKK